MVELSNGCICCTLREDLLTSITSLVEEQRFDHVLVESSGISEPLPVAETFTFQDEATGMRLGDIARLQNMVTVVDAASLFEQLGSLDRLIDRGWQAGEGDRRSVSMLLCDQLEFADVLLVNKADLISEAQLGAVEALVRKINPKAEVMRTTHSKVDPALLLDKARFRMERAEEHPQWLKEAREHEHTPETIEYGISSFIFRARRPFHPGRLHAALGGGDPPNPVRAGALRKLLRVKGFAWLAPWSTRQGDVALAGTQFTVSPGQPWWAAVRPKHWPEGMRNGRGGDEWHGQYGDRRTELVCIGQQLDHLAAQAQLEACLLNEAEMELGPGSWFALEDPFYEAWEAEKKREAEARSRHVMHQQQAPAVTHVLVLHKNEQVRMEVAMGVMERAGIAAHVAWRLLTAVDVHGQAIVCQGNEADMRRMSKMFGYIGMKTTMQAGSAPPQQVAQSQRAQAQQAGSELARWATHELILHRNESLVMEVAVGVLGRCGIAASDAMPLLSQVASDGQGAVSQGKEEDMRLMAGMFAELGMKVTVQPHNADVEAVETTAAEAAAPQATAAQTAAAETAAETEAAPAAASAVAAGTAVDDAAAAEVGSAAAEVAVIASVPRRDGGLEASQDRDRDLGTDGGDGVHAFGGSANAAEGEAAAAAEAAEEEAAELWWRGMTVEAAALRARAAEGVARAEAAEALAAARATVAVASEAAVLTTLEPVSGGACAPATEATEAELMTAWGRPPPPALPQSIPQLDSTLEEELCALLGAVHLEGRVPTALAWCDKQGVDSLEMLAEVKAEAELV